MFGCLGYATLCLHVDRMGRRSRPEWIICAAAQANRTLCDLPGGQSRGSFCFAACPRNFHFGTRPWPFNARPSWVGLHWTALCLNNGHPLSIYLSLSLVSVRYVRMQSTLCRLSTPGGSKVALQTADLGPRVVMMEEAFCAIPQPLARARARRNSIEGADSNSARSGKTSPPFPHSFVFIKKFYPEMEAEKSNQPFLWALCSNESGMRGLSKQKVVFVFGEGVHRS